MGPVPEVVTHSLLKAFRRCPRQALYKYADSLAPKSVSKPLKRGTWMHALLEAYYLGEDWKAVHKQYVAQYSKLFDEEKEALGDLPSELLLMMQSYLWHYHHDSTWTVHEVEFKLEATLPGGLKWQGKSDMLIEDETGLWIVDHKTHKQFPSFTQRILDQQSVLYLWAARENDIPVVGFIWNYVRTEGSKGVKFNLNGAMSAKQGAMDYVTAYRSLQAQGRDPKDFKEFLAPFKAQRYAPDQPQLSPFFQRHVLEKSDGMIERAVLEAAHTATNFAAYDFEDRDSVERAADRSCDWCSYKNLCTTELIGGNAANVRRQEFIVQDPFSYYERDEALT
jgi:RecB family exonuclease